MREFKHSTSRHDLNYIVRYMQRARIKLNFALKFKSNSRVCGLFVRRNNKDGKDGIIIPPGLYYLSGALDCNSRTGNKGRNCTRDVKFISKLTNLLGLGRMFSKLRK